MEDTDRDEMVRSNSVRIPKTPPKGVVLRKYSKVLTPCSYDLQQILTKKSGITDSKLEQEGSKFGVGKIIKDTATVVKVADRKKVSAADYSKNNKERLDKAKADVENGILNSVHVAAKTYGIPPSTLRDYIKASPRKPFRPKRGKSSITLTPEEEMEFRAFAVRRNELGCGLNYKQVVDTLQEVLLRIKTVQPSRMTGFEKCGQCLSQGYVYRLCKRGLD